MSEQRQSLVYESGDWQVHLGRRELLAAGVPVPIGSRAFEIVEVLVQSANELVTKDDLMDRIWPGATVGENTLQVHISAIRKAFGQDRALLKTASGRGYRLLGNWTARHQDAATASAGLQRIRLTGESAGTNFPAIVTRLIGRSAAVRQLQDLISAWRILTLTGPGGIGKTSLALKAARRVLGEFADGGWLVELASLSDPALVPTTVAQVLRLGLSGVNITAESVAHAVGSSHLLLLIDNCEHVIDAAANLVETLVRLCPRVTILATSREVLRVQGEMVYRVPPLEVPAEDDVDGDRILGHSAPALFIARTSEAHSGFASDTVVLKAIAAICRHLDGIPLAIEFAAARAVALGIEQVAAGLGDRFALLTSGRRTAVARHRTLRATLDWSYELLSEAEQELLRHLAIFVGPFSLDAACAVVADGASHVGIADGVGGLVGKSLVFRTADPMVAEFRLLETTRAYALDRLTESGAFAGVAHRHAAYLLEVLGTIDDERRSKPPDQYLTVFRRYADEVHASLEWALSAAGDAATGVVLTLAAVPLWFELSQMTVARARVEQALAHAEAGSDVEMRLRMASGHTLWYTTPDSDALEPAFARALEIAERIGATDTQTRALWGLWAARRSQGQYLAALGIAHRYAAAAARAGDFGAMHLSDRILGLTYHFLGQQRLARGFTERALRQPHPLEPGLGMGFQVETPAAMGSLLARILWLSGFPDQAKVAAYGAVGVAEKNGHSFSVCYATSLAGLPVALWTGDLGEARRLLDLLRAHFGRNQRMGLRVLAFERALRLRDGDDGEALIASFIESCGDPALLPPFSELATDAKIPVPLPGPEPAGEVWNAPELLRVDAELLLFHSAPGANVAAEAKLLRALEIARGQSALSWELRAATSLARLWHRRERAAEARDLLAGTYRKFSEGFGTSDLLRARNLMADLELDDPPQQRRGSE